MRYNVSRYRKVDEIMTTQAKDYLPLSQATYYILLSLRETRHGYAIMQDVESLSIGKVTIGPGTLYGALGKLEKQAIITRTDLDTKERRKYYKLTPLGKDVLILEYTRLKSLVENAQHIIQEMDVKKDDC